MQNSQKKKLITSTRKEGKKEILTNTIRKGKKKGNHFPLLNKVFRRRSLVIII